jgi:tetratricopeptide (TPR) repeat protein
MNASCLELAPLFAARPLGVLEAPDVARLDSHLEQGCSECASFASEVALAYGKAEPSSERAPRGALDAVLARVSREDASAALTVTVACTYCKGAIARAEAAFCASCLAPVHEDCFREHGRCSAPGCTETRLVQPRHAIPPRRSRAWPLVALVASLGAAALAAELSRERFLRRPNAAVDWKRIANNYALSKVEKGELERERARERRGFAERFLDRGRAEDLELRSDADRDESQAKKDFEEAEKELRKILEKDPDDAIALSNLANLYFNQLDRLDDAISLLERAVALDDTKPILRAVLGEMFFVRAERCGAKGDDPGARAARARAAEQYKEFLRRAPEDPNTAHIRARLDACREGTVAPEAMLSPPHEGDLLPTIVVLKTGKVYLGLTRPADDSPGGLTLHDPREGPAGPRFVHGQLTLPHDLIRYVKRGSWELGDDYWSTFATQPIDPWWRDQRLEAPEERR